MKIWLLVTLLLAVSSSVTYAAVVRFLPTYYSSRLQEDLDEISRGMAETISTYQTIEEASRAIELFEASSQVSVVILDDQGEQVWPLVVQAEATETTETEITDNVGVIEEDAVEEDTMEAGSVMEMTDNGDMISYTANLAEMAEDELRVVDSAFSQSASHSAVKRYDFKIGEAAYSMLVFGGMQPVNQAVEILRQIFPCILGISLAAACLSALAFALYLTAPVVRLSKISKSMAALDFENRYEGKRTDEIGVLGNGLNELSANLSHTLGALRQANEKLKSDIEMERQLEKKRIAFFSAVSHELKTPITILKGHLTGMLQGIGEYKNRDYYLERSWETADKMEALVRELLTVSRIENNKFTVQHTDVAEVLRQQLADMTELAEEKNLELAVDIPEHLYAEVNPGMLEKVFSNLLMNAIRYTPGDKGNEIRVIMRPEPEKMFYCSVENTGVFIPEEALGRLFEAFYRVEQSRSRLTGGSGLGLYIVKMVLEQHGGEYGICNTEEGVKFRFCL